MKFFPTCTTSPTIAGWPGFSAREIFDGGGTGVTMGVELPAAAVITAPMVVTYGTSGVAPYDPSVTSNAGKVLGIASTSAGIGGTVTVILEGPLEVPGGTYTPGTVFFAGTAGALRTTQPTTGLLVQVGYAADADTIVVQIGDPIELA